jgi:hypothetical protein
MFIDFMELQATVKALIPFPLFSCKTGLEKTLNLNPEGYEKDETGPNRR